MGQGAGTWQKLSQWKWENFEGTYLAVEGSFSIDILMDQNRSLSRDLKIFHWKSQDYLEEKEIENYNNIK